MIPHLDYCSAVYSDISNELSGQLQRLTNSGIRNIIGLRRQEHITPCRKRLGWILNVTRTDYFASLVMYRLVCMREPPLLRTLFKPFKTDKPARGPRKDLKIPLVPTDWGLYSFQVKYAKLWNLIPPCIRNLPTYSRFKRSIIICRLYFRKLEDAQ